MSRIAFCICGFQGPGTSGTPSLSPINGWFWLTDPFFSPNISGLPYVSWQDCFALAWNIKEITITWDLTAITPGSAGPVTTTPNGSQVIPIFNGGVNVPVANEQGLITGFNNAYIAFQFFGGGDIQEFFIPVGPAIDGTAPDITSGLSWLQLTIVFLTSPPGTTGSQLTAGSAAPTAAVTVTSSTIPSFAGMQFNEGQGSTWTGTISIEATAYWPYDNGTGPIFDATTGAQLIFPVPEGL